MVALKSRMAENGLCPKPTKQERRGGIEIKFSDVLGRWNGQKQERRGGIEMPSSPAMANNQQLGSRNAVVALK